MTKDLIETTDELETAVKYAGEICNIVQHTVKIVVDIWAIVKKIIDQKYARLYHLATHAKKARTRKKNAQRLCKEIKALFRPGIRMESVNI